MKEKIEQFVDNLWLLFVIQGIATLVFGLVALFWPDATLVTLVYLVAIYVFAAGVMVVVRSVMKRRREQSWWFGALFGIIAVAISIYLLARPTIAIGTFVAIVGILLLLRGVFDLFLAAYVIKAKDNRFLWIISGVLGIVAAIILWQYPVQAGSAFVWVLGLYAVIAGVVGLIYAYRARKVIDKIKVDLQLRLRK